MPIAGNYLAIRAFPGMAPRKHDRAVCRYLALQSAVAVGIGLALGVLMLATDAGGIASLILASSAPENVAVFLLGSAITFWPLVFATAVGVLARSEGSQRRP
jgi:hypothetical protein